MNTIGRKISQRNSRSRKPRILGRLLALVAASTLALSACAASASDLGATETSSSSTTASDGKGRTPEEIKESRVIRIGTFADKSPFGYVDKNGEYAGYDVEFGKRIAQDLGVELEWVPMAAQNRVEYLESGKVDITLANFTVTPDRAEKVDFANPYMKVSFGLVTPKGQEITDEADLANANIIIVKGTSQDAWVTANHPDWKVTKYEQYVEATNALIDGRGNAWITDNTEALAFTAQNSDFVTSITSFGEESTIAPAVQKGNTDLLNYINDLETRLAPERFFHRAFEMTLQPVYGDVISADELVIEGGKE